MYAIRSYYGFQSNVCSVYLLEPDRAHLVLAATDGLRQESVRKVRMSLQEGLAGLVAQESRPIMVEDAIQHSRFKHFPEAGEDSTRWVAESNAVPGKESFTASYVQLLYDLWNADESGVITSYSIHYTKLYE